MKINGASFIAALILAIGSCEFALSQEKLKIAVVPKNDESLFWKSVHQGAKMGAMASGVDILWKAPYTANDKDQQITIVEQFIAEGVSGIVLAPTDFEDLTVPVAKALKKDIPVLIFDSALKGKPGREFISQICINNRRAGSLAGEHMSKLLKGSGKVVLLRNTAGQANTTEREEGFLSAIEKSPGIRLVVKDRYAGATIEEAKRTSTDILNDHINVDGIFCPNERSTIGMLYALRDLKLAGKVKFIGFDTPSVSIDALKNGEISALIIQDPSLMGYLCIKTVVDYIKGKKIAPAIDMSVHLIIKDDLNSSDVQKLLTLPSMVEQQGK
jgi:ribose transport system substrate-binding protein